MEEPVNTPKPLIERLLPWVSGITMPLLIVVLSALWGVSNTMSTMAAENEVLEVRMNQMERAILEIKTSANQMSGAVNEMQVHQSTHNALIELKVDTIRKELENLREFYKENSKKDDK